VGLKQYLICKNLRAIIIHNSLLLGGILMLICLSVTLVQHPAKAVGRNEMPFGRDTRVVPCNIKLDRGPDPTTGMEDLGVGTPSS